VARGLLLLQVLGTAALQGGADRAIDEDVGRRAQAAGRRR
jgi:hypothetical protein